MKHVLYRYALTMVAVTGFNSQPVLAQSGTLKETKQVIKTYPFSDPNPVPPMVVNDKIARFYPYFMFDGFTTSGKDTAWNVVELENDYIKVKVLPGVGGKVYGAIEKSTGKEFVYLNKVLKFRSIGIRGPWTSGGIEHNFGLDVGHAPWTASPVDYALVKEKDGSVSCVVGGLDLATRTQWRVKIRLPHDKAYFETSALLYNPTPFHHSHLSWENAAFKTADDLKFHFPGTHHVGHDGSVGTWPIDEEGRDLSWYRNNNFGGSKSYHVIGSTRNWFGGYYQNEKFGFGHWAPYSDAAGKKLWIWTLSRSGEIWKDLLTDTDPHYIEGQSGVKFNQADIISGYHSPYKQLFLRPGHAETKTEYWFPVKGTEGMSDAGRDGVLHVNQENGNLLIRVQSLIDMSDSIMVMANGKKLFAGLVRLRPMQLYEKRIALPSEPFTVSLGKKKLYYNSTGKEDLIDRPILYPDSAGAKDAHRLFLLAEDRYSMRKYDNALDTYLACLQQDPSHTTALTRVAEICFRRLQYEDALRYVKKALAINTYEPAANYLYGVMLRSAGELEKAAEAFSVALMSFEFRSNAYTQLAGIHMQNQSFEEAAASATSALQYNTNNLAARQLLLTCYRRLKKTKEAAAAYEQMLVIDPLNHYARFEKYLLQSSATNLGGFHSAITNEFPNETYMELAMDYYRSGQIHETCQLLTMAKGSPTALYWLAYLQKDNAPAQSKHLLKEAQKLSPAFVFPFRDETVPVLEWALQQQDTWKTRYYLGLVYWHKGQTKKASELFRQIGEAADFAPFYIARALLAENNQKDQAGKDLRKALSLDANEWRTWHYYQQYLLANGRLKELEDVSGKSYSRFQLNPVISMDHAQALIVNEKYAQALTVLNKVQILPQEGAQEGHDLYVEALIGFALNKIKDKKYKEAIKHIDESRKWPENLGAGMPYNPDTRLQDYLAAYCFTKLNKKQAAEKLYDSIRNYTVSHYPAHGKTLNNFLGLAVPVGNKKEAQANAWLQKWTAKLDSLITWNILPGRSTAVQWVLAKQEGRTTDADKLKALLLVDKGNMWQRHFFEALELK